MGTPTFLRTRWAAIGAALAIALGGGGLGIVQATASSGERNVFIPITPCRLMDTRPATNVGPRATKISDQETYTVNAHGNNGECTGIPTDAVALSLNVTALNATTLSFLAIWPADQPQPANGSNLNPANGEPPTPNAVTTRLSPTGQFKIYNEDGTVNVIADINGYYVDHNHDDRYYTKAQTDAAKTQQMTIPPAAFRPDSEDVTDFEVDNIYGTYAIGASGNVAFKAPLLLPIGTRITSVTWYYRDNSAPSNLQMLVTTASLESFSQGTFSDFSFTSSGAVSSVRSSTLTSALDVTITESRAVGLLVSASNWPDESVAIKGVTIEYVLP